MPADIVLRGVRVHNLKGIDVTIPTRTPGGDHGRVGLRQEQPGLRHPVRGGPAALRREPVLLRPAVPGADGEAAGGRGGGDLPGDRHPPADALAQPALHGGDRHRDPRPPAAALRARGPRRLRRLRRARSGATRRRRWRERLLREAGGRAGPGGFRAAELAADARPPSARLRKRGFRRLLVGGEVGRRRRTWARRRSGRGAGARRPRECCARRSGAGSRSRWRRRFARAAAGPWSGGRAGSRCAVSEHFECPRCGRRLRRAAAAALLVQQPVRRLPGLPRLRQPDRGGPRPGGAGQAHGASGTARSSRGTSPTTATLQAQLRRFARRRGHPARRAVVLPGRGAPAAGARGRRGLPGRAGLLPLARGAQVPGPGARLPGPLPRLPGVPRLRRQPAAARGAAGAARGPLDPGPAAMPVGEARRFLAGLVRCPRPRSGWRGRVLQEIDRRLRFLEDVGLDYLDASTAPRRRCPGASRSGSRWPRRSAPASSGRCSSSTSRRWACTRGTPSG